MTTDDKEQHSANKNQGEGDRESARHYNDATQEFVESGKVDEAAEQAGEQDPDEASRSEQAGKERSREVDPAVHRDYQKPEK